MSAGPISTLDVAGAGPSLLSVGLVCVLTVVLGGVGLRLSRATSDFYVAGRAVSPGLNASAISGEYLSAASFLGVAGLIYEFGVDKLWLPVGYTLGYLVLLVLVAAPMRRSGAYTLPDFAEARLGSRVVRGIASVLVVAIGSLYLVPQFHGAGLVLTLVGSVPPWAGGALVAAVVTIVLGTAGMRSITVTQAIQYWIKLTAITVPAMVLIVLWLRSGAPRPELPGDAWHVPLTPRGPGDHPAYRTWSTILVLCLGTMGLPHVIVRYYTNPDGAAARRTTVHVLALLGIFYLALPVYAVLGRVHLPALPPGVGADSIVLRLPSLVVAEPFGELLVALLAGGAFAAFLSTASGVAMTVAGVLDQSVLRPWAVRMTGGDAPPIRSFRMAALCAVAGPYAASRLTEPLGLATTVILAFTIAASSFAPVLVLGVWWRALSTAGAASGLVVGALASAASIGIDLTYGPFDDWPGVLAATPGLWSVPLATFVTVVVSLATPSRVPASTARIMARLHTPERIDLVESRRWD